MKCRKPGIGRRRGISEAIGAVLFLFVFISVLYVLAAVLTAQNKVELAYLQSQDTLNLQGKENLILYLGSIDQGGQVHSTLRVFNIGSTSANVTGEVVATGPALTLNSSNSFNFVVPTNGNHTIDPFSCQGSNCALLTSEGGIHWISGTPPNVLYTLTISSSCSTGPSPGTYWYPAGAVIQLSVASGCSCSWSPPLQPPNAIKMTQDQVETC